MKRILAALSLVVILASLATPVSAASTVTIGITGPASVHVGSTLTLNVNLNIAGDNPNLVAFRVYIQYNAAQLTYVGIGSQIANWTYQPDAKVVPGQVVVLGNNSDQSHPITSSRRIFTITFRVSSTARNYGDGVHAYVATPADGSKYIASATSTTTEYTLNHVQYTTTLLAPLSGNADLKSLSVAGAKLDPAFAAGTTEYACSVPFETAKATIAAVPSDAGAKVAVTSPDLVPGETTDAKVVVTAATGATKTYTIHIARAQDPNYKPGADATLSNLAVEGFLLSPFFDAAKDSYVLWLPNEVEGVSVVATPTDRKAKAAVTGADGFVAGQDNPIAVVVTAEDGTTTKTYTIVAKRALPWDGSVTPQPTLPPGVTPTPTPPPFQRDDAAFPYIPVAVVMAVSIAGGIALMIRLDRGLPKRRVRAMYRSTDASMRREMRAEERERKRREAEEAKRLAAEAKDAEKRGG